MKPIIVNMHEMSDSTEVYESRPNPFFIYFIYLLLAIIVGGLTWMYFFKIDIVVKSNGIFKCEDSSYDISSSVSGKISECNISEGAFVNKGDILMVVNSDSVNESITDIKEMQEDLKQRISMLKAYNKSLDGDNSLMSGLSDNKYYTEFVNKKELLDTKISSSDGDTQNQREQYNKSLEDINDTISQYEEQIGKLSQTKDCIKNRNNIFNVSESYYHSIVESYIANYNFYTTKYDNQIKAYQTQITELEIQINGLKNSSGKSELQISELSKSKSGLESNVLDVRSEKETELYNLELQQISNIEQQTENIKETLITLKKNKSTVQAQIDTLSNQNPENSRKINILTEKTSVANELLS